MIIFNVKNYEFLIPVPRHIEVGGQSGQYPSRNNFITTFLTDLGASLAPPRTLYHQGKSLAIFLSQNQNLYRI